MCERCGDDLGTLDSALATCRTCRLAPPPFVRAVSYGPYQGRMRDAIHALKYDRLLPAARPLGRLLAQAIGSLAQETSGELLVIPVPLHSSKHLHRGFNQARLLAVHALGRLRRSHPAWRLELASRTVVRQRATDSQAGLTPRQRRQNVRGAFMVPHPAAVSGRNVLVIDDIMTTGATVRSITQALLRAGAQKVWVATLARAAHHLDDAGRRDTVYSQRQLRETAGNGLPGGEPYTPAGQANQPSF